jgi:hypothetical protein
MLGKLEDFFIKKISLKKKGKIAVLHLMQWKNGGGEVDGSKHG